MRRAGSARRASATREPSAELVRATCSGSASSPRSSTPLSASLPFGSALHLGLPPHAPFAGPRPRLSSSPRRPVLRSAHLPSRCEVPSVRVLEGFRLARIEHRWHLPFRAHAGRTETLASLGLSRVNAATLGGPRVSYTLQAIIGNVDTLGAVLGNLPSVALPQRKLLIPLTDEVRAANGHIPFLPFTDEGEHRIPASLATLCEKLSARGRIAYLEAEFFGGSGAQGMLVAEHGKVIMGPEVHPSAINSALRTIGVVTGDARDEFDALGLGERRDTSHWIRPHATFAETFETTFGFPPPPTLRELFDSKLRSSPLPVQLRFRHVPYVVELQYLLSLDDSANYDALGGRFCFAVNTDGNDMLIDVTSPRMHLLQRENCDIDSVGLTVADLLDAEYVPL